MRIYFLNGPVKGQHHNINFPTKGFPPMIKRIMAVYSGYFDSQEDWLFTALWIYRFLPLPFISLAWTFSPGFPLNEKEIAHQIVRTKNPQFHGIYHEDGKW